MSVESLKKLVRVFMTCTSSSALLTMTVFLSVTGCRGDLDSTLRAVVMPSITPANNEVWEGVAANEPIIATVDGIRIPSSRFEAALRTAGKNADPRKVLDAVVAEELVAQDAIRNGAVPNAGTYERSLVAHFTEFVIRDTYDPAKVPIDQIEELYRLQPIWARFNHYDIYSIQDFQYICCDGSPAGCSNWDVVACFEEAKVAMEAVYDAVLRDKPEPEDLSIVVERYVQSTPRLTYQEYDFSYDAERKIQKGRTLFDSRLVDRIVETGKGGWGKPVQSNFGWHVSYVNDHIAAEWRTLNDPGVQVEIATHFATRLQQNRFMDFLARRIPVQSLRLLATFYENHPAPSGSKLDVVLFPDALRSADEGNEANDTPL